MGSAGRRRAVGLVLAARQLFQQGLTPLSGVLADRLGAKPLIAIGMIVRAVGFAAMGFAATYELLMISAIVAAIGGALFESPRSAAVVALTDESERSTYFAKTGVVAGLGITAGTQLGALLLGVDFRLVSLVAAASYVLILVMILIWLPPVRVADERRHRCAVCDWPFAIAHFCPTPASWADTGSCRRSSRLRCRWWRPPSPDNPAPSPGSTLSTPPSRSFSATPCRVSSNARFGARTALIGGVLVTAAGLVFIGFSRDMISLLARGLRLLAGDRAGATDRADSGRRAG